MSVRDRAPASASRGGDFWSTLRETIVLAATLASFLASAWLLRRPAPAPIQIVPPPTPGAGKGRA